MILDINGLNGEQITITTLCSSDPNPLLWCSKTYTETIEIFSNYEVTSEVLQVSCPGAGDGNISVNILDLSTNSALQGATFEWSITDP